jgi:hypothetical protein
LLLALTVGVMLAGLLVGYADIHNSTEIIWENRFYFFVNLVMGVVSPKLLWLWPLLFSCTLYAVHIWALRHGYHQPYVEHDEESAPACFLVLFPCLFGGLLGGGARLLVSTLSRYARS